MSEQEKYQAAFETKLLAEALAKIHNTHLGSAEWMEVVDWTVKGILKERLDRLRRDLASGTQIEGNQPDQLPKP